MVRKTRTVEYDGRLLRQPLTRYSRLAYWHRAAQVVAEAVEAAVDASGVKRGAVSAAGIPDVRGGWVRHVCLDDPIRVTLELAPGVVSEDVIDQADTIAEALRVPSVVVERIRPGFVSVTAVRKSAEWPRYLPPALPVFGAYSEVYVGLSRESGHVRARWTELAHMVVQGTTRMGKTSFLYSLLSQYAEAPDVVVAGSDPSGILLRPWARRQDQHAGWQAVGTTSLEAHVSLLERLTKMMDSRISAIPEREDKTTVGESTPLVLVVMEEFPSLVNGLKQKSKQLHDEAIRYYWRLLSESAKAGMRMLIVAQRADADVLGGGYARAQCSTGVSFALDTAESLKLLHGSGDMDRLAQHTTAPPGQALVSLPGRGLDVVRVPHVDVGRYWDTVLGAGTAAA